MDSLRKAAVLLASLDADTADTLIDQMPQELARRARELLLTLDEIDPAEQKATVDEFLRLGLPAQGAELDGIEIEAGLASRLSRADSTDRADSAEHAEPSVGSEAESKPLGHESTTPRRDVPFSFLHEADARDLALHLQNEHPQTVAIVVAHLPPDRAAETLAALPATMQAEVITRLVDLRAADPEIVQELEHALHTHLARSAACPVHARGTSGVSAILQAAPAATRRHILENLAEHAPMLAAQLEPPAAVREMTFDDVVRLGDIPLGQVLSEVEADLLTLALAGSAPAFVQRVLEQLPRREAKLLRQALDHLGPTRLSDVEQAQRELVAAAQRLHCDGWRDRPHPLSLSLTI